MKHAPFLPVSRREMDDLGWDVCDVIIITGDAYVDHPAFGSALIGRYLESLGFRVGIIPQPDPDSGEDFLELGLPALFAGVTSGAMDSMVNHYTSLNRIRSDDAYSEGGIPGKRPDRAVLKYVNCIQRHMPGVPVVIGGIEASLRRVSHYDFWSDRIRRSILLDSKADLLVFGMGERAVAGIARALEQSDDPTGICGTGTWMSRKVFDEIDDGQYVILPSHEEITDETGLLIDLTAILERESNPWCGKPLVQFADSRAVVLQPPARPLSTEEMDGIYRLPFARRPHPSYRGEIPAYRMIRNSITVVRGCSGGCSFCALGLHQGRMISSRSPESVESEVRTLKKMDYFRGTVTDLGGPTANLYGLGCRGGEKLKTCRRFSCLYPEICPDFKTDHGPYIELLQNTGEIDGVRNVFISSGIRYDVALRDGHRFIEKLIRDHVSGHLKIAPEHFSESVLELMRKPSPDLWREFLQLFRELSLQAGKKQYIEPYIMVAFPGCGMNQMKVAARELSMQGMSPEKAQIFLPTPMTMATAMYCSGLEPGNRQPISVCRKPSGKKRQLALLPGHKVDGHSS